MPVERWVMDEIPEDRMTDYQWMQNMCSSLIANTPYVNTKLYVAGFTPLTIAFLRAWDMWVNSLRERHQGMPTLTLMHYNPNTDAYSGQLWR